MGNFNESVKRIYTLLTRDIWRKTDEDVRGIYRWLMNIFKAVFLSVRFFTAHRIMERASALTYYTLLALVPVVALMLSIGRIAGVQELISSTLANNAQGHNVAIQYILRFAESYLNQANNSVVMGLGMVLLLYVIYSLIGNIETVLNEIWEQKKGRTQLRKLTDYLSIMILMPIFLILSAGVQVFLETFISQDIHERIVSDALLRLLRWTPYLLTILLLTFLYVVMPNCKVRLKNAFAAALIAGGLFILFQHFYITGQIWMSKNNAIYGSFAALPLLLLWIQASWIICLYGAELSYASQNIDNYNFENLEQTLPRNDRDVLLVLIASLVYNRFAQEKTAPTSEEISTVLHLPARITGQLILQLEEKQIITNTNADNNHAGALWIPAKPTDRMTVAEVKRRLDTQGENQLKIDYKKSFPKLWKVFEQMDQAAQEKGSELLIRDMEIDDFKPILTEMVLNENFKPTKNKKKK